MGKLVVNLQDFSGGLSTDLKKGIPNSFGYSQALDFRKKPSQVSVLPGGTKASSGVVNDLVQNMVQTPDGSRYGIGDSGNFYKEDTSGVWTRVGNIGSGAYGLVYRQDTDSIYITSPTKASRYYPISGSPALEVDKYGASRSTDTGAYRTGGTSTYTPPVALVETASDINSFVSDIEPLYSIKVYIVTKGTGDWTITLHDDANNVLGTSTVTNANLTSNSLNEFVFSTPIRLLVKPNGRTYHFHVTSTVADGTLQSGSLARLDTANYEIWASRFVTPNNGMHPIALFQQYVCIGNERYLSVWEPLEDTPINAEWQRHRLTFPPGYEVCGLAFTDEFLAIACEKRSTSANREFQDGKIFFWDGTATTYNFFCDVPEGAPYALSSYKNVLYFHAGGALWANTGRKESVKVRTMPNTDSEFSSSGAYMVTYPNTMAVRRGILLMGWPSETSNQSIEHGVYSWGALDKNYPQSFGYSYVISTGTKLNTSGNLRIGMVRSFGDSLYYSWRDGSNYGVDRVDNSSSPATSASWESLIFDAGAVYKIKEANRLKISFNALPAGVTITPKYKINRASSWTYGAAYSTTNGTECYLQFPNDRFREIQFGYDVAITGSTTPEIIAVTLELDALSDERDV